jgi:hypothetical protein
VGGRDGSCPSRLRRLRQATAPTATLRAPTHPASGRLAIALLGLPATPAGGRLLTAVAAISGLGPEGGEGLAAAFQQTSPRPRPRQPTRCLRRTGIWSMVGRAHRRRCSSAAGQVSEESFTLSSEANARLLRPRLPPHLVTLLKTGRRLPRRWCATTPGARRRCSRRTTQTPRAPRRQRRRPLRVADRHPSTRRGPAHNGGPDRQLWTRRPPPKWTSFKPAPT